MTGELSPAQLKQQNNRDRVGRYAHAAPTSGLAATDAFPDPWAAGETVDNPQKANTPTLQESIAGRVLAVREHNGYHDSDFSALVEDRDGTFRWITTGSTASAGGFIATADATPEVRERYRMWWLRRRAEVDQAQAAYEQTLPAVGKTVTVTGGRKHAGKTGRINWYGPDQFRSDRHWTIYRALIETDTGEKFFVPADYLSLPDASGTLHPAQQTRHRHDSPLPPGVSPDAYAFAHYPHPR